ncbi:MAG: hypothetical protein KJP21_04820 [Bacteroidia bacterium]|nr:hypothetical protein [Bacteroidia bacterium]NNJ55026.1 hypothetical protein [Bacteroidia bacterium]
MLWFVISCKSKHVFESRKYNIQKQNVVLKYTFTDKNNGDVRIDSGYFYFLDSNLLTYRGFDGNSNYSIRNDSAEITSMDSTYSIAQASFYKERRSLWKFRDYLNIKSTLMDRNKSDLSDSLIHYVYKDFNRFIDFRFDSFGRIIQVLDVDIEEEYYVHHQHQYDITYLDNVPDRNYFKRSVNKSQPSVDTFINSDSLYPFNNLIELKNHIALDTVQFNKRKTFVLYSYIGCRPCMELKKDVTAMVNEGSLNSNDVVVVNSTDSIPQLSKYITKMNLPFIYYRTTYNYSRGSFPVIGYYENGKLVWSEIGYSNDIVKRIKREFKY